MLQSSLDQALGVLDYHINEIQDAPDLYSKFNDPLIDQNSCELGKAREYDGKILISPRSLPMFANKNNSRHENG